uniref:Uncharacterized protein n=1 Tax=Setaria italica TaxID=4555 RepID=K4ANP8_SETIT
MPTRHVKIQSLVSGLVSVDSGRQKRATGEEEAS